MSKPPSLSPKPICKITLPGFANAQASVLLEANPTASMTIS